MYILIALLLLPLSIFAETFECTVRDYICTFYNVHMDENMVVDFETATNATVADVKSIQFQNSTVDLTADELMDRLCEKFINLASVMVVGGGREDTLRCQIAQLPQVMNVASSEVVHKVKVINFVDDGDHKDPVHEKLDILLLGMVVIIGLLVLGGMAAALRTMAKRRRSNRTEFVWRDYNVELPEQIVT